MEHIYTVYAQRGQGAPEIFYFSDSYEKVIIYYYESIKEEGKINDDDTFLIDFYLIGKYPKDIDFITPGYSSSKIKMGKSSKYRIKFNNWEEVKKEYKTFKRNESLELILGK